MARRESRIANAANDLRPYSRGGVYRVKAVLPLVTTSSTGPGVCTLVVHPLYTQGTADCEISVEGGAPPSLPCHHSIRRRPRGWVAWPASATGARVYGRRRDAPSAGSVARRETAGRERAATRGDPAVRRTGAASTRRPLRPVDPCDRCRPRPRPRPMSTACPLTLPRRPVDPSNRDGARPPPVLFAARRPPPSDPQTLTSEPVPRSRQSRTATANREPRRGNREPRRAG